MDIVVASLSSASFQWKLRMKTEKPLWQWHGRSVACRGNCDFYKFIIIEFVAVIQPNFAGTTHIANDTDELRAAAIDEGGDRRRNNRNRETKCKTLIPHPSHSFGAWPSLNVFSIEVHSFVSARARTHVNFNCAIDTELTASQHIMRCNETLKWWNQHLKKTLNEVYGTG